MRLNHIVNKATSPSHKGVGKARLVFGLAGSELFGVVLVFAEDDFHGALGAHHGNFGMGPGQIHIAAQVLGSHHVIRATVGLAGDDGDLGHGAFRIRIEQLGTVLDDAAVFLRCARHEAGYVHKGDDGDVERITKAHKTRGLDAGLDVQTACQHQRLVGYNAYGLAAHAGKANQDVLGVVRLQLEEVAVIHGLEDELLHVIGLVGVAGHQGVERHVGTVGRVCRRTHRGFFLVIQRQVVVQAAQHHQRLYIVVESQIGYAALGGVGDGTAQLFGRDFFVRDGFHHFRAGHKHIAAVLDHEDKVRHGGRVHRPTSARAHDHGNLRNHA